MQYGFAHSSIGSYHVKNTIPCQDASIYMNLGNGLSLAAVADGVGSARRAEKGSRYAIAAVEEIFKRISNDNSSNVFDRQKLKSLLLDCFKYAFWLIRERADEEIGELSWYDTTLTVVILSKDFLIYGHSGDGGIIALEESGVYRKITEKQKDSDGISVIPLRAGEKYWKFDIVEGSFASLLVATDGIYDTFFPYLLKQIGDGLYIPLIRYFLDTTGVDNSKKAFDAFFTDKIDFILSDSYNQVHDDKTIAIIVNGDIKPKILNKEYYDEPDWDLLEKEWKKIAYPSLFNEEEQ